MTRQRPLTRPQTQPASPARRRLLGGALAAAAGLPLLARAQHEHHEAEAEVKVSSADYQVPRLQLVREDGRPAAFPAELDDGRVVMLNFIFTTCTAICPVTSQVFTEAQGLLKANLAKVHLMSVSIDPDNDTPARLREYAKRFSAGPQWNHYTGTLAASVALQKAFNAYRGDKMNHQPTTFLHKPGQSQWTRVDGFAPPSELAARVRAMLA